MRRLHQIPTWHPDSYWAASLYLDRSLLDRLRGIAYGSPDEFDAAIDPAALLELRSSTRLDAVNGSTQDCLVKSGDGDVLLLQGSVRAAPRYLLRRVGTTLSGEVSRRLFSGGLDGLLALETQRDLGETRPQVDVLNNVDDRVHVDRLDFTGGAGVYYREVFFHIPYLIATQLSAEGRHAAALRWLNYIFDPTAADDVVERLTAVSAAVDGGRLDVCAAAHDGHLWRLTRWSDGAWRGVYDDVEAHAGDPGRFIGVACAMAAGSLHICGVTPDGRLWHTVRAPDRSWQRFFGDVQNAAGDIGEARAVGVAGEGANVQMCARSMGRVSFSMGSAARMAGSGSATWRRRRAIAASSGASRARATPQG